MIFATKPGQLDGCSTTLKVSGQPDSFSMLVNVSGQPESSGIPVTASSLTGQVLNVSG